MEQGIGKTFTSSGRVSTITIKLYNSDKHEIVKQFVANTGAKALTVNEVPHLIPNGYNSAAGYYRGDHDVILNPELHAYNYPEVALHELIHWSGHSSRLKRSFIIKSENTGVVPYAISSYEEQNTEEMIAEIGSLFLLEALGLSTDYMERRFISITCFYPYADLNAAIEEAFRATEYILNLVEANKANPSVKELGIVKRLGRQFLSVFNKAA